MRIKKVFVFFLTFIYVITFAVSSFAAPTGTAAVYCETRFLVTDLTDGKVRLFTVMFKDISLGNVYTFEFEQKTGFNKDKTYTVLANTTYEITFIIDGKYEIVNKDGSEILKPAATVSGLTLDWVLKEKGDAIKYNYARNAEGDKVFAAWLMATETARTGEYEDYWETYFISKNWNSDEKGYFLQFSVCSEEYWDTYLTEGLTGFEKFCWSYLYATFVIYAHGVNPSDSFKDENAILRAFGNAIPGFIKNSEYHESIAKAFYDVILWQYHYFMETGDFYNFMTGGTYLGKNGVPSSSLLDAVKDDEKRQQGEAEAMERQFGELDEAARKINEMAKELKDAGNTDALPPMARDGLEIPSETADIPENEKKSGLDKVFEILKNNAISLSIAAVAFIAAGIIKHKKQNTNTDSDEEE
jgi:hypothetical protein